jgi:superfamily II DNA or RNA helicase
MIVGWHDLRDVFHDVTLERGLDYARRGRVRKARLTELPDGSMRIEAEVRGSEPVAYRVAVAVGSSTVRGPRIECSCTCPVGYNCKHGAATLIDFYKLEPARVEPADATAEDVEAEAATWPLTTAAPKAAVRSARPTTPPEHAAWLAQLRALRSEAPAAPRTQRMVFVIDVEPYRGLPAVTLLYGNVRKDGSLSRLMPANASLFDLLRNRPRYLGDADVPLVRALALASEPGSRGAHVLERDGALLRRMVEQGEAMVGGLGDPALRPLRWGPSRTASGRWQPDARGRQRFTLAVEPPAVAIALDGLWYLDAARGELGGIDADLDADLAQVLLQAPPIDAAEVDRVAEEMTNALAPLPAAVRRPPLPAALAVRELRAPGVVHVRLANAKVMESTRYAMSHLSGVAAFVHVRYGSLPVHLRDRGGARLHDGALVTPAIDAKLHEKSMNRLLSTGFMPLPDHPDQRPYESTLFLDESLVLNLMNGAVPRWRKAGWAIEIAPDFAWQVIQPESFFIDAEPQADQRWFDLELGVEVDGQRVSLIPIVARLLANRQLTDWLRAEDGEAGRTVNIRIDAQRLIRLPLARVRAIVQTLVELHGEGAGDAAGKLRLARTDAARLTELARAGYEWRGAPALRQLGERLANFSGIDEVAAPTGLKAELRPYQRAGLAWLQFLRSHDLAGILADDMGLGKTVQTIAHLLVEQEAGRLRQPALVVAPTSVIPNWQHELARFAPSLRTLLLHGSGRHGAFAEIAEHDVVLTTYPLLPRDIDELAKHEFHLAIFDEAQNLKNARTRAAEAAGRLHATSRIALSGTPLENNLAELWSQFNLLLPGFLGDSRRFAQLYRTPIEKRGDSARRAHLARRIRPFILRRTKDMVARELPPKTEIEHAVELTGGQRDLYETVRASMERRVREALQQRGLARSHIVVLDALLKLRQVCCDPRLVAGPTARKVKESAKLERLAELLPELVAEGRRVLLFSQFTSMLALIEERLAALDIDYVKLTGETKDRKTPVARFQGGEVPLFLVSLKAGGTGLNLTAADTVIHYDPWWNPAVENQATDRAHRIGQDKPVFVHRLIAAGTVEERIRALQARKADLARGILDEDAAVAKVLTAQDMQALFEPLSA